MSQSYTRRRATIETLEQRTLFAGVAADPVLTEIAPTVLSGWGLENANLDVRGMGFTSTSVIESNGSPLPTLYYGPTLLVGGLGADELSIAQTLSISVATPGEPDTAAQPLAITYPPTIATVNPVSTVAGGPDTTITVTGTEFMTQSVVEFDGLTIPTTYVNSAVLTATIPAADLNAGVGAITVANPSGATEAELPSEFVSAKADFPVTSPTTLNSMAPSAAMVGSADTTVTFTGTDFQPTSVAYIYLPAPADDGSDGSGTSLGSNTYDGGTLVSGGGLVLSTDAVATTNAATGNTPLATTFVSSTELTATIPAADLTSRTTLNIWVDSGPLGDTSQFQFHVTPPAPTLVGVSPAVATIGNPDLVVALTGTDFQTTSVAAVNGMPQQTGYVSTDELAVLIPAVDLAALGSLSLTVVTPGDSDTANQVTAAQMFTVSPPPPGLWPVTSVGTVPPNVVTGARVHGNVMVALTDTSATAEHGLSTIEVFAVPNGSGDLSTLAPVATVKRRLNIAAGASHTLAIPVKALPAFAGSYTLLVRSTDSTGRVLTALSGPEVTVGPPEVSLAFSVTPTTLTAGEPVRFAVTVTNSGNIDYTGFLQIGISIAYANGTGDAATPVLATVFLHGRARANRAVTQDAIGRIPTTLTPGDYDVLLEVDRDGTSSPTFIPVTVG